MTFADTLTHYTAQPSAIVAANYSERQALREAA